MNLWLGGPFQNHNGGQVGLFVDIFKVFEVKCLSYTIILGLILSVYVGCMNSLGREGGFLETGRVGGVGLFDAITNFVESSVFVVQLLKFIF